jgi:hypothetical protein
MGKAQEIKCANGVPVPFAPVSCPHIESNNTRFIRMQFKTKLRKSISHRLLYAVCIVSILNHADIVIGIAHQLTCPFDPWSYLLFEPQIKHIVQEYI